MGPRKIIDYNDGSVRGVSLSPTQITKPKPGTYDLDDLVDKVAEIVRVLNDLSRTDGPGYTDFINIVAFASPTTVRLCHGYNCAVSFSIRDVNDPGILYVTSVINTETDQNTLVLDLYGNCTLTVRVEPAS